MSSNAQGLSKQGRSQVSNGNLPKSGDYWNLEWVIECPTKENRERDELEAQNCIYMRLCAKAPLSQ